LKDLLDHMTLFSGKLKSADIAFIGAMAVSLAVFGKLLVSLVEFSLAHEYCSHIILIPGISAFFVYLNRNSIRKVFHTWAYGALFAIPAVPILIWAFARKSTLDPNDFLAAATFAIVCVWIGIFAVCYGFPSLRAASFPLGLLLLMIPLPTLVLQATTHFLQQGSTEITWWILQAVGQPALKDGFTIYMPKLAIFVAEECSGIRSSLALLITCLLAGHMMLRSNWRRTLFVLLTIPVALIKNGIRIGTLVLLSIHVDMRFMTSSLHRDGGFVFFFIALLIMALFLKILQKSEGVRVTPVAKSLRGAEV
jgi:exosortase